MSYKKRKLASFSTDAMETGLLIIDDNKRKRLNDFLECLSQNIAKPSKETKEIKVCYKQYTI